MERAALRGAIQTHLLQIGSSTDRGGLIVLHDQLHHAATAAGQWQFVSIITPPAAAAYLFGGLHRDSTGVSFRQLCARPLVLTLYRMQPGARAVPALHLHACHMLHQPSVGRLVEEPAERVPAASS